MMEYYKEISCTDFAKETLGTMIRISGYLVLSKDGEPSIADSTGSIKLSLSSEMLKNLAHEQTIRIFGQVGEDSVKIDHISPVKLDLDRLAVLRRMEEKN
ncbi:MAG: hypothetical protein ACTSP4_16315 [Candidatus Hodarchaeales archaeon]